MSDITEREGCPVDILIDLSDPPSDGAGALVDSQDEDKENTLPVTDSVENTRRDSLTLSQPLDFEDRVFQDVTDKITGSQAAAKVSSPEVRLIDEEEFDFDLPVSPSEKQDCPDKALDDEDEEVFFGPVGFTEKCIAAGVAEEAIKPLSPLRPDQVAELAKEAYSVAYRISNMKVASPAETTAAPPKPRHVASLFRVRGTVSDQDTDVNSEQSHKNTESSMNDVNISGVQELTGSTENIPSASPTKHQRSGTFTIEPVKNLLQDSSSCSGGKARISHQGGENNRTVAKKAAAQGSRLQAPTSKLTRFNRSRSNLTKGNVQTTTAANSGSKDPSVSGVPSQAARSRRSLQLPNADVGRTDRQRIGSGDSDKSLPERGSKSAMSLPKPSVRRAQSMSMKSALPMRGSKLAAPSQRLVLKPYNQQNKQPAPDDSNTSVPSSLPKGPATKPQLLQSSQLQRRSLAFGRGRGHPTTQTGPVKVPAQPLAKMGDTVERPYNPSIAVGPNSQCPSTPVRGERMSQPKKLSVPSDKSTPVKSSSSSSSVCGSTPGSVSRRSMSFLPTPSKHRTSAAESIPPSPLSRTSSTNSSLSRRSVISSSDPDSPVFGQNAGSRLPRNRRVSGSKENDIGSDIDGQGVSPFPFKPRKPLVQNTPDLPTRTLSRWSPLRRPKPVPLEDQVSMCTKRSGTR